MLLIRWFLGFNVVDVLFVRVVGAHFVFGFVGLFLGGCFVTAVVFMFGVICVQVGLDLFCVLW